MKIIKFITLFLILINGLILSSCGPTNVIIDESAETKFTEEFNNTIIEENPQFTIKDAQSMIIDFYKSTGENPDVYYKFNKNDYGIIIQYTLTNFTDKQSVVDNINNNNFNWSLFVSDLNSKNEVIYKLLQDNGYKNDLFYIVNTANGDQLILFKYSELNGSESIDYINQTEISDVENVG